MYIFRSMKINKSEYTQTYIYYVGSYNLVYDKKPIIVYTIRNP